MKLDLDNIKAEIKENISILVSNGDLHESKVLIDEYKKIVPNDIESYSIDSVISIMEGNLENAEEILKQGLIQDDNNFDLLYNLGYLYEIKEKYVKSLVIYRKALTKNYYRVNIDMVDSKIKEVKEKIYSNLENEFGLCISNIDNILFIDFDVSEKTHLIAEVLEEYGINVDLAYGNKSPSTQLTRHSNPYRKILGITNIDHLIEYAKYYNYNCIYVFSASNEFKNYLKMKKLKVLDGYLFQKTDKEIIKYFSENNFKLNIKYEYAESDRISIVIPTYNRSYYLNRVLTFMSNYKYIKPKIIILDSSEESGKLQNESIVKKFKNANITYIHYTSEVNFFEKLNRGLKIVETEYVALCADDDFFTEEGIIESVKKLDEEKSLYSVKGKNLYFTYSMGNLFEYDWFEGLKQNGSMERLKEITKGFVPSLIYQVFRRNEFKKMYSFIGDNINALPKNETFTEYLFYFMVIATGKIDKINVDLNVRDKSVPRATEVKNFPHALVEGDFNYNYETFCDLLKKYLIYLEENVENFNEDIKRAFCEFLVNFLCIPREYIEIVNEKFNVEKLEQGMRKSWVWPSNL